MVDFINEPCPHEKAFKELLQFLGKELSEAKPNDVDQWARNLFCVYTYHVSYQGNYCLLWDYVVEAVNGCTPDPRRPYTYRKTKAKIDELDARVKREEMEDAETNQA